MVDNVLQWTRGGWCSYFGTDTEALKASEHPTLRHFLQAHDGRQNIIVIDVRSTTLLMFVCLLFNRSLKRSMTTPCYRASWYPGRLAEYKIVARGERLTSLDPFGSARATLVALRSFAQCETYLHWILEVTSSLSKTLGHVFATLLGYVDHMETTNAH